MGLITMTLYSAKCDEPGCSADLVSDQNDEYDFDFMERLDEYVWDNAWQKLEAGGSTLYFCHDHHREATEPPIAINDPTPLPPPLDGLE